MTDDELLARFEDGSMNAADFHHAQHVQAAFIYLTRYPMLDALGRFSAALARLAAVNGRPERYHETISWAYMFLIHERMARAGGAISWDQFREANPEILEQGRNVLGKYYRDDTLESGLARKVFVMPDKF